MTDVNVSTPRPLGTPDPVSSSTPTEEDERLGSRMVYDVVTQNLKALGAVSLEEYLASNSVGETSNPSNSQPESSSSSSATASPKPEPEPVLVPKHEVDDTPPDGEVDLVAAAPSRAAQDDANVNASASIADEVPTDADGRPSPAVVSKTEYKFADDGFDLEGHPVVTEHHHTLLEVSDGTISPYWLAIKDPRGTGLWGCALRIEFTDENWRVWSTDTTFENAVDAQVACCETYAEEMREFICHFAEGCWPTDECRDSKPDFHWDDICDLPTWTVQQFFEALPKPFPEDVGNKTANEINAPSWFNSMLQTSRGSKLSANFIWTEASTHGLHGCLLRLTAPGQCRSYLVDSRFSKRAEAKAAVCLLAMYEGVGDFIRGLAKQVEDRLPADVRKRVSSLYLPTLVSECRKKRPEIQPQFEYVTEDECNGCTLTITLPHPTNPTTHTYTVPPEYRTRSDSKLAVVAQAVSQGVLDLLGFDSKVLSPNYKPTSSSSTPSGSQKRKHDSSDDSRASTPSGNTSDSRRKRRKLPTEGGSNQPQQKNHRSPQRSNFRRQPLAHNGYRQPWTGPAPSNAYPNVYSAQPNIPYQPQMSNIPPTYAHPYGYPPGSYPPNSNPYATNAASGPYYGGQPAPIPQSQYNTLPPSVQQYHHPSIPYPSNMVSQASPQNPTQTYPPMPQTAVYPSAHSATYSQPFQPYVPAPYPQPYGYPASAPGAVQPTAAIPYVNQSSTTASSQSILPTQASSQVAAKASLPPKPGATTMARVSESKPILKRGPTRSRPSKPLGGKVMVAVEPTPHSSVTELYDFCRASSLAIPEFRNEIVMETRGENRHKVWVMIGNRKLEVQDTFSSLSQGQENVARKALELLRTQPKT